MALWLSKVGMGVWYLYRYLKQLKEMKFKVLFTMYLFIVCLVCCYGFPIDSSLNSAKNSHSRSLLDISCGIGNYSNAGNCVQCPVLSTSPAGSTSISQCSCLAGTTWNGGSCGCASGQFEWTQSVYKFESANDLSLFGFNGVTQITNPSNCKSGYCAQSTAPFGTLNGLFSTAAFGNPSSFAISFWYYIPGSLYPVPDGTLFMQISGPTFNPVHPMYYDGWQMSVGNGNFGTNVPYNLGGGASSVNYNTWTNLCIVFQTYTMVYLYQNGVLSNAAQISGYWTKSGSNLLSFFGFQGLYDEIAFYPTYLFPSDVMNIYKNGIQDCVQCPTNNYCASGALSPTICPANSYAPAGMSTCQYQCNIGNYLNSGSCLPCPLLSTSAIGASSNAQCSCLAGTTLSGSNCVCPSGQYNKTSSIYKFESVVDLSFLSASYASLVTNVNMCQLGYCAKLSGITKGQRPSTFQTSAIGSPSSFSISFWYNYPRSVQIDSGRRPESVLSPSQPQAGRRSPESAQTLPRVARFDLSLIGLASFGQRSGFLSPEAAAASFLFNSKAPSLSTVLY